MIKFRISNLQLLVKAKLFKVKFPKLILLFTLFFSLSYLIFNFFPKNFNFSSETQAQTGGTTYYISPTSPPGNDQNDGLSETTPLATFNKAWELLYPGDTLILLDGVYRQRLNPNKRNGEAGKPITIRAKNDGKAVIDGDTNGDGIGDLVPFHLGDTWTGESGQNPVGNYFVVEGLVVKNGRYGTISIWGHNNILRRISAYNAHTDENAAVIGLLTNNSNNLVEDCVAAGSGRKMIYSFGGSNNTFRRCFAASLEWRGINFDPGAWPWQDTIELYGGANHTIENNIVYGMATNGFNIQNQSGVAANVSGNKILGSMAIGMGMKWDGTSMTWPCPYPYGGTYANRQCTQLSGWNGVRKGAGIIDPVVDTLIQDLFAWGNGGVGITGDSGGSNNRLVRVTAVNNGIGDPEPAEGAGVNGYGLEGYSSIEDSFIGDTSYQGGGARLQYRYIDGVLKDGSDGTPAQLLWPWPMEERIREEFRTHLVKYYTLEPGDPYDVYNPELQNFSVTNTIYPILAQYGAVPITGSADLNNDNLVNATDAAILFNNWFNPATSSADIYSDNRVNGIDFSYLKRDWQL
jgi:hypothetical protein